jgi:outer membrane protein assembly factor BamB
MKRRALAAALAVGLLATTNLALAQAPPQPQAPVYIEDSPAAQDMLDEAAHLRRQDRLAEAAAKYQAVIEQYAQKLTTVSPQLYTDMSRWVRQQIASDADLLAAYRRSYEATAQRALEQASVPQVDADALAAVLGRYALCSAGLEAGLRLAGVCLERADGIEAAAVLDSLEGHPDLARQMGRWQQLQAMAGAIAGWPSRQQKHTAALESGDREAREQLQSWLRQWQPPAPPPVVVSAGQDPTLTLPKPVVRPLWTLKTSQAMSNNEAAPGEQRSAVVPVAEGQRLFINDNVAVLALDRSSGRVLWRHRVEDDEGTPLTLNSMMRMGIPDQRGVAIEGNVLAAIVGQVSVMRVNVMGRGQPTRLICLEKSDGSLRWQRNPGQLDPTLVNAFFHGTPIVAHGRIYALARRSQMSGFQDAFLLAVDARSGNLLWRRHLSSSVVTNRLSVQSLSQMTLADGWIFVADNLGSAACVSARDGEIRWLAVLVDSARGPREQSFQMAMAEGQWPGPVSVPAGVLVPSSTGAIVVLDPQTGKTLRELKEPLAQSQYVVKAGSDVLGIGPTVCLLDGSTLEVRWRRRIANPEEANSPIGRGFIAGQRLLLPLATRMVVLDMRDGNNLGEYPQDGGGNVLAMRDQVIVAASGELSAFMTWEDAQRQLQAQIQENPADAYAPLALAHLALSLEKPQSLLPAVDAALTALARHRQNAAASDDMQRHVFTQIMGFTEADGVDPALKRQLFDRLASITAGPGDEVAYQLALAQYLENTNQLQDAVDHYQAVLMDPLLSRQLHQQEHGARQAGLEATLRLRALIKRVGPSTYARHELAARQRLEQLLSMPGTTPAALVELARQYPLSAVAPQALSAAAARLHQAGDNKQAVILLHRAFAQAQRDPEILPGILGQIVSIYEQQGQLRQARHWLNRWAREFPALTPLRESRPMPVEQWLAELNQRGDLDTPLPGLSLPLRQPRLLSARLLTPVEPRSPAVNDAIVTLAGQTVQFRRAPRFEVAWSLTVPDAQVQLISLTPRQTLLWSPESGMITAVHNATGEPAWPAVNAQDLIKELGGELERQAARPIEQRRFIEQLNPMGQVIRNGKVEPLIRKPPPGYFVVASEQVICVADRGGRTVGVHRETGQVLWRFICPMDELRHVQVSEDALALGGAMDPGTHEESGMLLVLDPVTGEPRLPTIDERAAPLWLGLGGDGLMFYATANEVVAHHLADGDLAWRLAIADPPLVGQGRVGLDSLVLRQRGPRTLGDDLLLLIDPSSGELVERYPIALRDQESMDLRAVEGLWHLQADRQVVAISDRGRLVWRDAIGEPQQSLMMQLIGERHVVVVGLMDGLLRRDRRAALFGDAQVGMIGGVEIRIGGREVEAADPAPAAPAPNAQDNWEYQLYLLDRRGGALVEHRTLGPLRQPIDAQRGLFLDHFLILGAGSQTLVIPDNSAGAD